MQDLAPFDVGHNNELSIAIVRLAVVEYVRYYVAYLAELTTSDAQNNNIRLVMLDLFRRWYAVPMDVDDSSDVPPVEAPSPFDTCVTVICVEPMSSDSEWVVRCINDLCRNWFHLECAIRLRADQCPMCRVEWPANWRYNNAPTSRRTGPVANRPLIGGRYSGAWRHITSPVPRSRRRPHISANMRRRASPRRDRSAWLIGDAQSVERRSSRRSNVGVCHVHTAMKRLQSES